jgi:phage gpG-like protein
LSKNYKKHKAKIKPSAGLLEFDDFLLGSIQYGPPSGMSVEIGSPMEYAATQQMGDKDRNIPPRPYLGLSSQDEEEIEDVMDAFIDELMK